MIIPRPLNLQSSENDAFSLVEISVPTTRNCLIADSAKMMNFWFPTYNTSFTWMIKAPISTWFSSNEYMRISDFICLNPFLISDSRNCMNHLMGASLVPKRGFKIRNPWVGRKFSQIGFRWMRKSTPWQFHHIRRNRDAPIWFRQIVTLQKCLWNIQRSYFKRKQYG